MASTGVRKLVISSCKCFGSGMIDAAGRKYIWREKWSTEINVEKSTVMHTRKRRGNTCTDHFSIGGRSFHGYLLT